MKTIAANLAGRRGVTLIAVLVCLGVATALLLASVQASLRQQRQVRRELQMEQTIWVLDAGISYAISQIRSGDYDGETITIDSAPAKYELAEIKIEVENEPTLAGGAGKLKLRVTARVSSDGFTTQKSLEITVDKSKQSSSE